MWFDGANGGDGYYGGAREKRRIGAGYYRFDEIFRFVRELQPNVTIFSGAHDDSDIRWCGNERGYVCDDSRATVVRTGVFCDGKYSNPDYVPTRNEGSPNGEFFRVNEADFPLRRGWFYHEGERGTTKSGAYLAKLYAGTVGKAILRGKSIGNKRIRLLKEQVPVKSGCCVASVRRRFHTRSTAPIRQSSTRS